MARTCALYNFINFTSLIGAVTSSSNEVGTKVTQNTAYAMLITLMFYNMYLAYGVYTNSQGARKATVVASSQGYSIIKGIRQRPSQPKQEWKTPENHKARLMLYKMLCGAIDEAVSDVNGPLSKSIEHAVEKIIKEKLKASLPQLILGFSGLTLVGANNLSAEQVMCILFASITVAYMTPVIIDSSTFSSTISRPIAKKLCAPVADVSAEPLGQAASAGFKCALKLGLFTAEEAKTLTARNNNLNHLLAVHLIQLAVYLQVLYLAL